VVDELSAQHMTTGINKSEVYKVFPS